MNAFRSALVVILLVLPGAASDLPESGTPAQEAVKTAFSVLVGFPLTDQTVGSGALLVPGTVIPLTDEPAVGSVVEKSLSFSKAAEKLWSTFRLDPRRQLQQGKIELAAVGKPVELPALVEAKVKITATLIRFDSSNATFRIVFTQGDKTLADSTANVTRGGRAVVGGMDGTAAPYIFVFIEPDKAAAQPSGAKAGQVPLGITEPNPIYKTQIMYPEDAKKERVQGVVVLSVLIDERGDVLDASALEDPDSRLTKAAIESVRQWKFQPAIDSAGKPIRVHASVTFNFKLK